MRLASLLLLCLPPPLPGPVLGMLLLVLVQQQLLT
jgi:putative effector of murein hydrolase LrgA (UPF0299 family)